MEHQYKLQHGPDGITWVSLEPLYSDICQQLDNPANHDNQLVIDSLFAVKAFVGALIDEGRHQLYSNDKRDDESSYKDSLQ